VKNMTAARQAAADFLPAFISTVLFA